MPLLHFDYTDENKMRLDAYLVFCMPEYSRSHIAHLIKRSHVTVNDIIAKKPGTIIDTNTHITVEIPPPEISDILPSCNTSYDVIYEDNNTLIINKPRGLVVHPGAGNWTNTLVNELLGRNDMDFDIKHTQRPGIVHRLDKDTSGIMLIAKHDASMAYYSDLFANRKIVKRYLCFVHGKPDTPHAFIQAPIARDPKNRMRMTINQGGKDASTEFETLWTNAHYSLLHVTLHTGRTHQIRVHLASIGLPVVHDATYGKSDNGDKQLLHAYSLDLTLYQKEVPRHFVAKPPIDMYTFADQNKVPHDLLMP